MIREVIWSLILKRKHKHINSIVAVKVGLLFFKIVFVVDNDILVTDISNSN